MKKLIMVNGIMGVGKSTISEKLADRLMPSVYLDGDWCWKMNPWAFTEENKRMVISNITYLLNAYLSNSGFRYIIFCWVMHQEQIIEEILSRLHGDYELHKISLICSEDVLRSRIMQDVRKGMRTADSIEASIVRMQCYKEMNTVKIDVSDLTATEAAERIASIVN
ncbi:AAA family ATPase [Sporolactobacillus shoreicorticis]|uniref:AAA family ATPase n=1 Tax=Sporolactobacillus shoreicorticis TaxID=1923877 RepID=A0ABW5S2G6_9BACL|nr:AAA family ATPase [Sporolactobacillus shoreicorticis]MCO7125393.1 AAA family ATPase [Sporolactobacillus shoreicorticis]